MLSCPNGMADMAVIKALTSRRHASGEYESASICLLYAGSLGEALNDIKPLDRAGHIVSMFGRGRLRR